MSGATQPSAARRCRRTPRTGRNRSGISGAELEHDRRQPELLDGASSLLALVRQLAQRRRNKDPKPAVGVWICAAGTVLDESSVLSEASYENRINRTVTVAATVAVGPGLARRVTDR